MLHIAGDGCQCDGFVIACGTVSLWQLVVPWSRHSDSSSLFDEYTHTNIYMPSLWREYTYWYLISLALRQNGRHFAADDIFEYIFFNENVNILKNDRNFSMGLDTGLAFFRATSYCPNQCWHIPSTHICIYIYIYIYRSVGVTESSIMALYYDRTMTETEMSGWLSWLSLRALRLAFRWWLGRSSWRHIHFIDKTTIQSYLPLYSVLGTSLLLWIYVSIYSYHRPYKHHILPVCFTFLCILPLYILCIYSVCIESRGIATFWC